MIFFLDLLEHMKPFHIIWLLGTHISPELCQMSQRAIKHTQWYIQTVQNSERDTSEAPLITRLMRDLRNRNQG